MKSIYLLTGDIGGTNSRMALYDAAERDCGHDKPLVEKYYRNAEHIPTDCNDDPEIFPQKIIIPFLKFCWEENEGSKDTLAAFCDVQILATLAVAGIVENNSVRLTNLGGILIDGNAIGKDSNESYLDHIVVCKILNDFVAVSWNSGIS